MTQLRVQNATRGQMLVAAGRVADSFWTRLRGLIGSKPLASGEGLLIGPCSSVHPHFMSLPIDLLYVNGAQQVVGIDRSLMPWRFGHFYRRVHFVIELPPGTADATGTHVGDQLQAQGYEV